MSFDWREYFTFAERLCDNIAADECACRVGISRAYYAAFNISKEFVFHKKIDLLYGGGEHERLWSSLQENPNPDISKIGFLGNTIKGLRVISDYRSMQSIDKKDLENACLTTRKILELCKNNWCV